MSASAWNWLLKKGLIIDIIENAMQVSKALLIPNPFAFLLFHYWAVGILPINRHNFLPSSKKRSYKKSIFSAEQ